jgi:hypothetical protein
MIDVHSHRKSVFQDPLEHFQKGSHPEFAAWKSHMHETDLQAYLLQEDLCIGSSKCLFPSFFAEFVFLSLYFYLNLCFTEFVFFGLLFLKCWQLIFSMQMEQGI